MGGMLTQLVALEVPDRVRAYVLMDTCPASLRGLDPDLMAAAVSVVREQGIDALADISAGAEGPLDTPATLRLKEERPGYEDWCDAKLRACSPAMYAAMVTEIADQEDRLPRFGELTMPTLVMVGEQDRPFRKASQRMHDALSDSRLVVFPDAGHSPQLENPAAWYEALTGFLREAGA
ncbi:MAG: alpha/beta fold hydrolase [Acidimicrobiia bacterium]|nr:alpha/beta fold hydrolase [Acidimicrobiia bacterium]